MWHKFSFIRHAGFQEVALDIRATFQIYCLFSKWYEKIGGRSPGSFIRSQDLYPADFADLFKSVVYSWLSAVSVQSDKEVVPAEFFLEIGDTFAD